METREGASGERRDMTMTAMGNLGMSALFYGYDYHPDLKLLEHAHGSKYSLEKGHCTNSDVSTQIGSFARRILRSLTVDNTRGLCPRETITVMWRGLRF